MFPLGKMPCRREPDGNFSIQGPDGRWWVIYEDRGLQRGVLQQNYDQMVAGKRKVRFVSKEGETLYETTFDRFLNLIGEKL